MSRGDFKHDHEFTALSQRLETPGMQPAPASERAIAGREAAKPSRHRGAGAGGRAHRRHGAPAASALRHPPARRGGGRASGPKAASEGSPGPGAAAPRRTERPLGPDTGPDGFTLPEATGLGRHLGPSSGRWGATTGGALALAFAALRSTPSRRCRRPLSRAAVAAHRRALTCAPTGRRSPSGGQGLVTPRQLCGPGEVGLLRQPRRAKGAGARAGARHVAEATLPTRPPS